MKRPTEAESAAYSVWGTNTIYYSRNWRVTYKELRGGREEGACCLRAMKMTNDRGGRRVSEQRHVTVQEHGNTLPT